MIAPQNLKTHPPPHNHTRIHYTNSQMCAALYLSARGLIKMFYRPKTLLSIAKQHSVGDNSTKGRYNHRICRYHPLPATHLH